MSSGHLRDCLTDYTWSVWATTLRGSVMTQEGHQEEGNTQIQDGLAMS
jgi:hypothetical protein